jgi:cation diffusion facilitator family transporter
MEPDLSATITKHPRPFPTLSETSLNILPSRVSTHTPPVPQSSRTPQVGDKDDRENGLSTAVENMAGDEARDPVARHASIPAATAGQSDVEIESQVTNGRFARLSGEQDPYGLSTRYKSQSELESIRANTSRKRGGLGTQGILGSPSVGKDNAVEAGLANRKLAGCLPLPEFGRTAMKMHGVKGFYEAQNATIERLLKSVDEHRAEARQEAGADHFRFQVAVYGSFAANLILAGLQVYGAISSGSLSLFTTMADAIFDPLSNVTLIVTNRAVRHVDPSRFPSGKARLETVGNIAFCFIMTAVSFILIAFSARELTEGGEGVNSFHLPSVIAVAIAFVTKLGLFLYTWAIKDKYSQIRILWADHRNDLLINGFGLLTSVGGSKLAWWIDPAGAIVLSLLISVIWLRTAFLEFLLLVGVVASVDAQQLITYVCLTHSEHIRQIDTVRVYHSGPRLIAEVDVVMDPAATLMATHDVAEALQFKLESLPDVERAYVHVDYETTHRPEHAYRKDL